MTEKIEWFYLDWTEYEIWWWAEYNAGEWIEIKNWTDYSAMQWPSPDGFHVPAITEWQWVKTIMDSLSLTTWDNWRTNLHMPFAGMRLTTSAAIDFQGSYGIYWSSSPSGAADPDYAKYLVIDSAFVDATTGSYRAFTLSIRCFKDSYVTPDSSWTVVQWTSWSAWIFWNQSEGLISITDWTTGYTMMDKNLWATTVYNDWDTLTQANMGNMYQWWNNYWFPSTWSVTTSSTQVDASAYWPWNYYSSNTLIIWSTDWSSVHNDNLWWWVTWGVAYDNAITNTGVLSVNGQTGNVTIQTGGNYTAGNWIDITNDEIWLDGTYEWTDYSAMQWPAPEWFHVPLNTEWQAVRDIRVALGGGSKDWTNFGIALKLPFAGYRNRWNSTVSSQGSNGYYWSSTRYNNDYAYHFLFDRYDIAPQSSDPRAYGSSVRCFKDTPTIPTSSWTKLYWTSIEAGWIFWSSTDWLISLSSDWNTWITIADKNLGATTVWNSGDTLSEANCGKYYQRWNNYGFAWTWTVTTSSTQIDASVYWPWNYYSSSTFITWSKDWSSVHNDNLRWWETWILTASWNLVLWDKLYKIVTSTTAPASWTASNIITIVTD